MKLLNLLENEDGLTDEEREKIKKRSELMYKTLKKGSFVIENFKKKFNCKYVLSDNYHSDVTYEFESEDSYNLIPLSSICVKEIFIYIPEKLLEFNDAADIFSLQKIDETFRKYNVQLYLGEPPKCKEIYEFATMSKLGPPHVVSPFITFLEYEDWVQKFGPL